MSAAAEPCRPRVAGEREAEILDAAVDQLLEVGYDRLTMDGVAQQAKASKATLYRRWASKQCLVVDAVLRSKQAAAVEFPDTGNLRDDLVESFCGTHGLEQDAVTRLLGVVATALQTDEAFAEEFRNRFLMPKVAGMQEVYRRAAARGELGSGADPALLGPALAGILLHRSFVLGDTITRDLVERVVDQIIIPAATRAPSPSDQPKERP